jgi:hypothetical protein
MTDPVIKAYDTGADYAKHMGYKTIGMQDNPYNADDELALRKAWYRGYSDACRSAAEDLIE